MNINHSSALKIFKKEIGQANHMLITIMVGLDGINEYGVEASKDFRTSWNPRDKKASVDRSKVFAKKASLSWAVDCLDMYLRIINQTPTLLMSRELKQSFDDNNNSRSVYKRINLICEYYHNFSVNYALVDLLICWRNRMTHFNAENNISSQNRQLLKDNFKSIYAAHCNLDIIATLNSFDKGSVPTFKEVTSLIRSTINLVTEIDQILITKCDVEQYAGQIIFEYLKENERGRLNNILSKTTSKAEKSLKQILCQNGFCIDGEYTDADKFCEELSKLSCSEVLGKLREKIL